MGNVQPQSGIRPRSNGIYNGPLFGGHHAGDFSLARQAPVDCVKGLPSVPRGVTFGHPPPAWEFHRDSPTWDNTANTKYCSTPSSQRQSQHQQMQSQGGQGGQGMHVMNP